MNGKCMSMLLPVLAYVETSLDEIYSVTSPPYPTKGLDTSTNTSIQFSKPNPFAPRTRNSERNAGMKANSNGKNRN